VGGRIDIKPDDVAQLVDEVGIVRELELSHPMGLEAVRAPDGLDRADADAGRSFFRDRNFCWKPAGAAIMAPVQWVASRGGSASVRMADSTVRFNPLG
jgi:hypothetical protein